jgi:CHAD domain-containing protein
MPDGKWIQGLAPEMPVAEAARVVLAARFDVVRHFLPLAADRPNEDIEYVHQLRVGSRRAGAALRVFAECLPKKQVKIAKRALRAVRQAAGGARDWDVFLAGLGQAKPLQSAAGGPALDFLRGYGLAERAAAQDQLVAAAAEVGPWFNEDATKVSGRVHEPRGEPLPLLTLASDHLRGLFTNFTGSLAADPADPAELHQVRIAAKRLRYEIEIFVDCAAPPLRDQLYPAIEDLQELLGDTQDAAVGIERLEGLRDRVKRNLGPGWKRLSPGITGLLRGLRAKLKASPNAFRTWRTKWETLAKEHPVDSLFPAATAAGT